MERALPFRFASGVTSPDLGGVAQGDEIFALQPVERGVVGEVVAVAVRHDAAKRLAALVVPGEGGIGAFDPQVAVHRQEPQRGVAQQGARQDAGLGQDLEAVADPQDIAAAGRVVVDRAHDRRMRRHRAAAQVVAEAEAAGDDDQVETGDVGILVPDHLGLGAEGGFQRDGHVALAVDAGEEDDAGFHLEAAGAPDCCEVLVMRRTLPELNRELQRSWTGFASRPEIAEYSKSGATHQTTLTDLTPTGPTLTGPERGTGCRADKNNGIQPGGGNQGVDAGRHAVDAGKPFDPGKAAPEPRIGMAADAHDLLAATGISKHFGGTQALQDVSLSLNAGEILALLGENGAGKSTLIKILAGVYTLDSGSVSFRGADVTGSLRRLPIAFIHQDLGLIDWMTVAENICITLGFPRRRGLINRGLIDWGAARQRASVALNALGADIDPDMRIQDLSRTEKSLVAIARALTTEAAILVLDEPTASLPADEVARLFDALRRLRGLGVAMIYVSHRLDEVFEIADRMVVLRDGRVAGERRVSDTTPDEAILLIVGREPSQVFRRPAERDGAPRLALEGVTVDVAGPVDCEIHAGEIVGFVGLRGAGHESIGRALFGVVPTSGGTVRLDSKTILVRSPQEAMALGINLVCADRVGKSIMPNLTVRENLFLNPVAAGLRLYSWLAPNRENRSAQALGKQVGLRPNDPTLAIEMLSGGNQQKIVVGRWLHLAAKVYVFEDPTAGVDVGAKAEIYRLFDVALQAGAAIVIVSTDFEEVAKVCHRALVFDRGRVVATLGAADLSVENLLAAASAKIIRPTEDGSSVSVGPNPDNFAAGDSGVGVHAVH